MTGRRRTISPRIIRRSSGNFPLSLSPGNRHCRKRRPRNLSAPKGGRRGGKKLLRQRLLASEVTHHVDSAKVMKITKLSTLLIASSAWLCCCVHAEQGKASAK